MSNFTKKDREEILRIAGRIGNDLESLKVLGLNPVVGKNYKGEISIFLSKSLKNTLSSVIMFDQNIIGEFIGKGD